MHDPDELEELAERTDLATRIRTAFASVPRPETPITEGREPFDEDIEAALAGRTADDVTPADAHEVRMELAALRPEAWHYYLPALLRIILVDGNYVDSLDTSVFAMLVPPEDPAAAKAFERRMELLDRSQRDALACYVDWYSEGESVLPGRDRALAYWHG